MYTYGEMAVDAKNLQDLALQIARLPPAERMQFINTVLMLAELGRSEEPGEAFGRKDLGLHPGTVLASCREKLSHALSLTGAPGWGLGKAGLLAAILYVDQQGSWQAAFTTPLLNRLVRGINEEGGWEMNVQSLHGMERKGYLSRRAGTHPIQFCFTAEGYHYARDLAEQS